MKKRFPPWYYLAQMTGAYALFWSVYALVDSYLGSYEIYVRTWMVFFTIQSFVLCVLWWYVPSVLGIMALRLLSAMTYLVIGLLTQEVDTIAYVLCFCVVYLLYMGFELVLLLYNLQAQSSKRI